MRQRPHIAIVGGGITGLAAARSLTRRAHGPDAPRVTLLEAGDHLGGKIRSLEFAGSTVDLGPEALLTAQPGAIRLCAELGLGDELVAPVQSKTAVWTRGRLRELPPGILGGLPDGIGPIVRSGILSPAGIVRAGADLVLPGKSRDQPDEAVGALIRRRLGKQALERMIDPLLGGIYAGDPDHLSLRATAPRLELLARDNRSLIRGLLVAGRRSAPGPGGAMFKTLPGGLQRLPAALARELDSAEVRLHDRVVGLVETADGRYRLDTAAGCRHLVDGVILTLPAYHAADLLAHCAPAAARELQEIEYASIAVVWLAFDRAALPPLPAGSGFLVPRVERRVLSACTWASAKWPHLAHPDRVLLRCSVGRGRPETMLLDAQTLVRHVLSDLRDALQVRGNPLETHVTRWDRAMPQYTVGHLERVERVRAAIASLPRVKLAGAAYGGMGVPQCIAQGEEAALELASELRWDKPSENRGSDEHQHAYVRGA